MSAPTGAVLVASTTIVPTQPIHPVTGVAVISTVTPPSAVFSGFIILLAADAWTTDTKGNIGLAVKPLVGQAVMLVFDGTKWWPVGKP